MVNVYLQHSRVFRGGVTARLLDYETSDIRVFNKGDRLEVEFFIDSKGGGQTNLLVEISEKDFPILVKAMYLIKPSLVADFLETLSNNYISLKKKYADLEDENEELKDDAKDLAQHFASRFGMKATKKKATKKKATKKKARRR
jgi:hypothetical protein